MPKFPDVTSRLVGEDGNVFNIIGIVSRDLKRAGHIQEAKEFSEKCMNASSYDEVLQISMDYVEVE